MLTPDDQELIVVFGIVIRLKQSRIKHRKHSGCVFFSLFCFRMLQFLHNSKDCIISRLEPRGGKRRGSTLYIFGWGCAVRAAHIHIAFL